MKKIVNFIVILVLVFNLCNITTYAEKEISVYVNGSKVEFDVEPCIVDGRTMVPLRKIFEELNATVGWFGEKQEIWALRGVIAVHMNIGSNKMYKNIEEFYLDVPPQIINDRTFVPVRAIAESFDADVQWNSETNEVNINVEDVEEYCPYCTEGKVGCSICFIKFASKNKSLNNLRKAINGKSISYVNDCFDTYINTSRDFLDHILECDTWGHNFCTECNGTGYIYSDTSSQSISNTYRIPTYEKYPKVPDWGKITNDTLRAETKDGDTYFYAYEINKNSKELKEYTNALKELGYVDLDISEYDTGNMCMIAYVNKNIEPKTIVIIASPKQETDTLITFIAIVTGKDVDAVINQLNISSYYTKYSKNSTEITKVLNLMEKVDDEISDAEERIERYNKEISEIDEKIAISKKLLENPAADGNSIVKEIEKSEEKRQKLVNLTYKYEDIIEELEEKKEMLKSLLNKLMQ